MLIKVKVHNNILAALGRVLILKMETKMR